MASVEITQMLATAAEACDEKKAEDIRILALDPAESSLTDYFLICTGTNDRQTVAITDEIELQLKRQYGTYPNSVEGRRQGEWILMDYVDFIVHVFLPEKRAYYGLERLRPSATTLSLADLNAEVTSTIAAQRSKKAAKELATPSNGSAPVTRKRSAKKTATKATANKAASDSLSTLAGTRKATAKRAEKKLATNTTKLASPLL